MSFGVHLLGIQKEDVIDMWYAETTISLHEHVESHTCVCCMVFHGYHLGVFYALTKTLNRRELPRFVRPYDAEKTQRSCL